MSEQAVAEFLLESRENLARVENDLVAMEGGSAPSAERIAAIFRAVHTIKGTTGFLGFARLEALVHQGEGLLSAIRDGRRAASKEVASALLDMIDAVRRFLDEIEATGADATTDASVAGAVLARLLGAGPATQGAPEPGWAEGGGLELGLLAEADGSVRVDVRLLDQLMDLVGELVLVRNQALRIAGEAGETPFAAPVQRLNLIATELQQRVMKTRMQPIGALWTKLPRLVRDLGRLCGKQVRLELEGGATELDRTIIEAIKDPLTHLVRNAVDHGIEAPAARAAKGKRPEGLLHLRAYHEGGNVNLEVADDGAGIDWRRVADKAVQLGLVTAEQAQRLDEAERSALLFRPGFTTTDQVTTVSGRGVGLDVVRSNLEQIGGTVDVLDRAGGGTVVRVKIPLTLAIIPALIVTSAGARYAVPQANVVEIARVEDRAGLERVLDAPVYRLRGRLLTLLDLDRELAPDEATWRPPAGAAHIVVVRAEERTFGLLVEGVVDGEEIVVKPLPRQVKDAGAFAGATIMGDGRVALILDTLGLAARANLLGRSDGAAQVEPRRRAEDAERMLLLELHGGERAAVRLDSVSRLEELRPELVERSGGGQVVQHRGEILPLFALEQLLGRPVERGQGGGRIPVIVHTGPEGSIGLTVERIVDIVDEAAQLRRRSARPGVAGTVVVQQRVTELLDLPALVELARGRVGAS